MDTLATFNALVSSGLNEAQARCFVETLWAAVHGEFDYELAQAKLADSGYTQTQSVLIARGIDDAARAAGRIEGAPRWGFTKSSNGAKP